VAAMTSASTRLRVITSFFILFSFRFDSFLKIATY